MNIKLDLAGHVKDHEGIWQRKAPISSTFQDLGDWEKTDCVLETTRLGGAWSWQKHNGRWSWKMHTSQRAFIACQSVGQHPRGWQETEFKTVYLFLSLGVITFPFWKPMPYRKQIHIMILPPLGKKNSHFKTGNDIPSTFGSEPTLIPLDANMVLGITSARSTLHQKNNFPSFIFPSPLSSWVGPWESPNSLDLAASADVCRIAFLLCSETSVGNRGHQDGIYGKSWGFWYKALSLSWVAAPVILRIPLVDCWLSPIPACFKAPSWLLQSSWADMSQVPIVLSMSSIPGLLKVTNILQSMWIV